MEILIFILGLCAGSFVNMLVFRTAEKYKLIKKNKNRQRERSFCDFCGRQLRWWENVPVVSWVIQEGRSRCCGSPLPWQYPIVEMGMGILFLLNFRALGQGNALSVQIVMGFVIITMLVFAGAFDVKYMVLPDFSTIILIGVALLAMGLGQGIALSLRITAAGAGAGFLWLLYLVTRGKGMGFGDVKLAVFMGLWLGWPKIILAFWLAFVVGGVVGLGLMVVGRVKRKSVIAFGPFLIVGTLISWWWGDKIIKLLNY